MTRLCGVCKKERHVALFPRRKDGKVTFTCRDCANLKAKAWRRLNCGKPGMNLKTTHKHLPRSIPMVDKDKEVMERFVRARTQKVANEYRRLDAVQ